MMDNMTVTSAQYVANQDNNDSIVKAVIDNVTMYVPVNPDNRHYQAILEWVAEGNTIEEAD